MCGIISAKELKIKSETSKLIIVGKKLHDAADTGKFTCKISNDLLIGKVSSKLVEAGYTLHKWGDEDTIVKWGTDTIETQQRGF